MFIKSASRSECPQGAPFQRYGQGNNTNINTTRSERIDRRECQPEYIILSANLPLESRPEGMVWKAADRLLAVGRFCPFLDETVDYVYTVERPMIQERENGWTCWLAPSLRKQNSHEAYTANAGKKENSVV